jgi:hypothetical protein
VARELGHFWEPYPTRLTTDQSVGRTRLHALDTRLPQETTFPPGLRDVVSAVSYGVEITLAIVGLALAGRERRAAVALIVGVALAYGFGYALFIAKLRYRIVIMPGVFLPRGSGSCCCARGWAPRPPTSSRRPNPTADRGSPAGRHAAGARWPSA